MITETIKEPAPRRTLTHSNCWCGSRADYTTELTNARIGTGRFPRCLTHARRDLGTGDFRLADR